MGVMTGRDTDGVRTGPGASRGLSRKPVFLVVAAVGLILVIIAIKVLVFRTPANIPGKAFDVRSRTGGSFAPGECLIVFVENGGWHWTGPWSGRLSQDRRKVIDVIPYTGPLSEPQLWNYGIMFGPVFFCTPEGYILAEGHRLSSIHELIERFDVESHDTDADQPPEETAALPSTLHLTPLRSHREREENLWRIWATFDIDGKSTGIFTNKKHRALIQEFLDNEMAQVYNLPDGIDR